MLYSRRRKASRSHGIRSRTLHWDYLWLWSQHLPLLQLSLLLFAFWVLCEGIFLHLVFLMTSDSSSFKEPIYLPFPLSVYFENFYSKLNFFLFRRHFIPLRLWLKHRNRWRKRRARKVIKHRASYYLNLVVHWKHFISESDKQITKYLL